MSQQHILIIIAIVLALSVISHLFNKPTEHFSFFGPSLAKPPSPAPAMPPMPPMPAMPPMPSMPATPATPLMPAMPAAALGSMQDTRTVDSYLPNYIVDVQRRCQPGEQDTERYCIRQGCPNGMEQGTGSGSELCFAKCLDGYDSNGMSRCFKRCPTGFQTNTTTCVNPGHTFKKDVVPCKGCLGEPREARTVLISNLEAQPSRKVGPIVMTSTGSYATNLEPLLDVEYLSGTVWGMRGHEPVTEYFDPALPALPALPSLPSLPALSALPESIPKVTINLGANSNRIDDPEQPCPRGYTLSGDLCYENCPPHYRDTNDGNCVKGGYTIDRESYDRGGGVPYVVKRAKFEQIFRSY